MDRRRPVATSQYSMSPFNVPMIRVWPSSEKIKLRIGPWQRPIVARNCPVARSQSLTLASAPGSARTRPSGENARQFDGLLISESRGDVTASETGASRSQSLAVPSTLLDATRRPSGEKATRFTREEFPFSSRLICEVSVDHSPMKGSEPPIARSLLSGEKARDRTFLEPDSML